MKAVAVAFPQGDPAVTYGSNSNALAMTSWSQALHFLLWLYRFSSILTLVLPGSIRTSPSLLQYFQIKNPQIFCDAECRFGRAYIQIVPKRARH